MKKKWKNAAERTAAYRERLAQKQEAADAAASEESVSRHWDLRFFGESAYDHNAQTAADEIHIHRQFLRALGEPDVQDGESLRALAKRTWTSLLNAKDIGICSGSKSDNVEIPLFNPKTQQFEGGPWYMIDDVHDGLNEDWFEKHWTGPDGTDPDQPIDVSSLPPLPEPTVNRCPCFLRGTEA